MSKALVEMKSLAPTAGLTLLAWTAILPGLLYFLIVLLGLVGVVAPARFLLGPLLLHAWSTPLLLIAVVGGPVMSVVGSLCTEDRKHRLQPLAEACSWIAVLLLIANVLFVLFYIDRLVAIPD